MAIAMEISRVKLKLKKSETPGDEIVYVDSHQALETLKKPHPTKGGKSMLTRMDLMLILGMRLMLNGEEFWVLDKRRSERYGSSPREIRPALPHYMHTVLTGKAEIDYYVYRLPERSSASTRSTWSTSSSLTPRTSTAPLPGQIHPLLTGHPP